MVGREANKVPSGDTGESQSQASHLETTKPRPAGSRSASRVPRGGAGAGGEGWGRGRSAPEAGGRERPAPSVPRPWLRAWQRSRAPPRCCPGGEPPRRGLQVPGSPEAGAGRSLAQFPGIRRAGKRRGGRSGRRAVSAREGGARAEAGPTWAGVLRAREGAGRAGGTGSGLSGLHGACGSVPARRAAHGRLSAGAPARRAAQHAARGPTPRPGARSGATTARGPALGPGARSAAAAWALMAARRGSA